MKTNKLSAVMAALMALAASGAAFGDTLEERLASRPTLADLAEYAYAHSPEVQGARADWEAKVETVRVAGGYPDPEVMIEQMGIDSPGYSARLTFPIPFPGKTSAYEEAAGKEASAARVELDLVIRELNLALTESGAEIAYMQEALKIAGKNRELLARLSDLSENAYVKDRAQLIDIVRARAQVAQTAFDAALVSELLDAEKAKLNARLGRASDAPLGEFSLSKVLPLTYPLAEIEKMTLLRAYEIKGGLLEIEREKAAERAARLETYPNFSLGVFKNPLDVNDKNTYGVSAGFSVPLWFSKNAGMKAAANARARKAEAGLEARRNSLRAEIADLYFRVGNAKRLVDLYAGTLLPQAAKSLGLAEAWMNAGQAGFSDYAEIASTYYGFELALSRARADHAKYLARLERYAGADLTAGTVGGEAGK